MGYRSLYESLVSDCRGGRGLILAINGELLRLWNSLGFGPGGTTTASLVGGQLTLVNGSKQYLVSAESGTVDNLTSISAIPGDVGREIIIRAAVGHTITIVDGPNMRLGGIDFVLNDQYDAIRLMCVASEVFIDLGRYSNG